MDGHFIEDAGRHDLVGEVTRMDCLTISDGIVRTGISEVGRRSGVEAPPRRDPPSHKEPGMLAARGIITLESCSGQRKTVEQRDCPESSLTHVRTDFGPRSVQNRVCGAMSPTACRRGSDAASASGHGWCVPRLRFEPARLTAAVAVKSAIRVVGSSPKAIIPSIPKTTNPANDSTANTNTIRRWSPACGLYPFDRFGGLARNATPPRIVMRVRPSSRFVPLIQSASLIEGVSSMPRAPP